MRFLLILLLLITLSHARLFKRAWIDTADGSFNVDSIRDVPFNTDAFWKATLVSFGLEADSHHSIVLIPYQDAGFEKPHTGVSPFYTDLYDELEEVKKGVFIEKSGIKVTQRFGKYNLPSGSSILKELPAFQDTGYNIIERIYKASNAHFGFTNKFPPTVDSNDNVEEVHSDHPKAYKLGTNDCQTTARMLMRSIAPGNAV